MAGAGWDSKGFNEDQPFGKDATIVTADNIQHAQMRRAARNRIQQGIGSPADYEMIAGTEALIQSIRREKS